MKFDLETMETILLPIFAICGVLVAASVTAVIVKAATMIVFFGHP